MAAIDALEFELKSNNKILLGYYCLHPCFIFKTEIQICHNCISQI